jgi:oligopeptide/dipeptide ABC transporter ATP-binding protein
MSKPLLSIRNLRTYFYTYAGVVKALEGVNLDIHKGETVGLVGETGCGKSVTSLSILRLVPSPPGKIVDGEVWFHDIDLLKISEEEMRRIRGKKITMVFQDPMTYINPVLTMGDQVSEVILLHQDLNQEVIRMKIEDLTEKLKQLNPSSSRAQELKSRIDQLKVMEANPPKASKRDLKRAAAKKTIDVLKLVRMPYPDKVVNQYPHELSGGMRQRAMIAMALSCGPELLIADEATTSLDVTIQAQILHLLNELKKEIGASILIITHDLGIVAEMCDKVGVMYAGNMIEYADTKALFKNPLHPYTKGLLDSIPKLHKDVERLKIIPGMVPNLINPPTGCRFHPRCPAVMDICSTNFPPTTEPEPNHFVNCYLYPEA